MAYKELIKNFETIRDYMRDFYVYGFKSRNAFTAKSARSYDDARRRVESWLGDYMGFRQTPDGKNVFLSIDSQSISCNPLYEGWKASSFTDKDITLHFILMDILWTPEEQKTASEIVDTVYAYLDKSPEPMEMEESTILKKLREYVKVGILTAEKDGRCLLYSRSKDLDLTGMTDFLDFFSEAAPCGVVGSFLLDRKSAHDSPFTFKHHYITPALDEEILAQLLEAMENKTAVIGTKRNRYGKSPAQVSLVPLQIYISSQTGRQYLMAHNLKSGQIQSYRVDYLSNIRPGKPFSGYDDLKKNFQAIAEHLWGVSCPDSKQELEHVEFIVQAEKAYIAERLRREKRVGTVVQLDQTHYRFSADIWDSSEMLPWIRTFTGRISNIHFSNQDVQKRFEEDLEQMYRIYGLTGGEDCDLQ